MIQAGLSIIVTLLLVVGVHEAGHALTAIWSGVSIQRISIGFGKPLFLWKLKSKIELVWARWPLGGYVQLLDTRIPGVNIGPNECLRCFNKKPFSTRFLILIAGALANLILAFSALVLFFMLGFRYIPPVVPEILPNGIAEKAGLTKGSRIIDIANQPTLSWQKASMVLLMNMGKKDLALTFEDPQGRLKKTELNLSSRKQSSLSKFLGFEKIQKPQILRFTGIPFMSAVKEAWRSAWYLTAFYLMMIKQVLTAQVPFSWLLGPFAMVMITIKSFSEGLSAFLYYIANFSLAIGIVNLLPIPGLDGGSIVYALVEKIRGKPHSLAMEILLYRLALIAFALFFMHLLRNDLRRFFG